jgi:hypothetical protein
MTTGIDFSQTKQYSLSIRLSADGFSFSIHRPGASEPPYYEAYPTNPGYSLTANLKEMLARTDALQHEFRDTTILMDTPRFTTVPQALFEDEQMERVFYQNFAPVHNEVVLCNELGQSEAVVVFGMDKHAYNWLTEHYPEARFFAAVSPLIEHFARRSAQSEVRQLYVHLREQQLEALVFDHGQPQLINVFACSVNPDRVYYLLYIVQQLGLDAERDEIHLCGELREKETLTEELRRFVRTVSVASPTGSSLPYDMTTLMLYD